MLRISYSLIIILTFVFSTQAIKASDLNDSIPQKCLNKTYIKSYFGDFVPLILSPIKWDKKDWSIAAPIVGVATLAFIFDEKIAEFAQKNRSISLDKSNEYFFDPFGKMYYTVPLMGSLYLYGLVENKTKPKVVALDFVKASVYSGVIITGIKHIAHRQRPYQTTPKNSMLWDGPIPSDWNYTSFASGHTVMAFTFASVLANHYNDRKWIPVTAYTIASLSGLARIYDDKHWSSDVIIGAALGYAIGKFVVNNNKYCNYSINPILSNNFSGLSLSFGI